MDNDLPPDHRTLQSRIIAKLGDLAVVDAGRYHLNVLLDGREVKVPRDMIKSPQGEWGTAFELSHAIFVDTQQALSAEQQDRIHENIKKEFKGYFKIE